VILICLAHHWYNSEIAEFHIFGSSTGSILILEKGEIQTKSSVVCSQPYSLDHNKLNLGAPKGFPATSSLFVISNVPTHNPFTGIALSEQDG
jgi:hypothetical protein